MLHEVQNKIKMFTIYMSIIMAAVRFISDSIYVLPLDFKARHVKGWATKFKIVI
jgi:hypothetical protein